MADKSKVDLRVEELLPTKLETEQEHMTRTDTIPSPDARRVVAANLARALAARKRPA